MPWGTWRGWPLGGGGGTIGGSGTINYIAKFTAATTIGNSNITDNGSLVTVNSNANFPDDKELQFGNTAGGDYLIKHRSADDYLIIQAKHGTKNQLRFIGNNITGVEWGMVIANNEINATNKTARIKLLHYTNAEEPITILYAKSWSTLSWIWIGGGLADENAVEQIRFAVAANTTTLQGTDYVIIDGPNTRMNFINAVCKYSKGGTTSILNSNATIEISESSTPHLVMEDLFTRTGGFAMSSSGLCLACDGNGIEIRNGVTNSGDFTATGTRRFYINGSNVEFPTLRSTDPGAFSKQIWYDPADSNRVKYRP